VKRKRKNFNEIVMQTSVFITMRSIDMPTKNPVAKPKPATRNLKKKAAVPSKPKATQTTSKISAHNIVPQQRTDLDVEHFRSLLIEERQRMEEELEQVRNRTTDMENGLPEEGESGDEDTADLASAMMDKEMDLSVEDELKDVLMQVDRAFQKIEEGTYGICDVSSEPIPNSRLELIPYATLTVECQAMAES
jgi:DnaK suppressor protein